MDSKGNNSLENTILWLESLSDDEQKLVFRKEIIKALGVEDYDIKYILDDIRTSSEYATIFFHLNSYIKLCSAKPSKYGNQKSDIEKKITNAKKRIIDDLKFLYKTTTLHYDGGLIARLEKEMNEIEIDQHRYNISYREPSLRSAKKDLFKALVEDCSTGKRRAAELCKILSIKKSS